MGNSMELNGTTTYTTIQNYDRCNYMTLCVNTLPHIVNYIVFTYVQDCGTATPTIGHTNICNHMELQHAQLHDIT